jgi:hypothetical protein
MEDETVDPTYTWAQLLSMTRNEAISVLLGDLEVFENLPVVGMKKVRKYIKAEQSLLPENKEDFDWLLEATKEMIEAAEADKTEEIVGRITGVTNAVSHGVVPEEEVPISLADTPTVDLVAKVTGTEELSDAMQALVEYLDEQIEEITAMKDRNNYQTARRMAFRQVRALIIPPVEEEKVSA